MNDISVYANPVAQFAAKYPYIFIDSHRVKKGYTSHRLKLSEAEKYYENAKKIGIPVSIQHYTLFDDYHVIMIGSYA